MTYPDTYNGLHTHLDEQVRVSASVAVPLLLKLFQPSSVLDVGCGSGIWLSEFAQHNVEVKGLDGDYIDRATLRIPQDRFAAVNLSQPFAMLRPFDLAICLEVAEHIAESAADAFIDSIAKSAPAILFSAAIPGQGGMGHANEQWPSYWKAKFAARGYRAFDTLRRALWLREDVLYWYAQNSLLYVSESALERYPRLAEEPREFIVDCIHPWRYLTLDRTARAGEAPSLSFLAKSVPGATARFVKSRFGVPLKLRELSHG